MSCRRDGHLHILGDVPFSGADGLDIDTYGGELGVTEPFLHEVEWDAEFNSRA